MARDQPVVRLPTLHADQVRAYWAYLKFPRFVFRAGRRYGKTKFLEAIVADAAFKGGKVGFFTPEVKYGAEPFLNLKAALEPLVDTSSRVEGVIRLAPTKQQDGIVRQGQVDFWSLRDNELAGRGRSYDLVVFDEHAFNKPSVKDTWEKAVRPTLFDRSGRAIFASNTRGIDDDNHFFQLHQMVEAQEPGWGEWHAPTAANPLLPMRRADESEADHAIRRAEAIEEIRRENAPLVFEQEFEANFVSWAGEAFFHLDKMFENGQPVEPPAHCDAVFATIDTATKTGKDNDGTAVCYWARTMPGFGPHELVLLDWDCQQIEGSLLEAWLPTVFQRLEGFATLCKARAGSIGAFIEDKSSGMVLLQQADRRGWPAHPIDSKLTSMGKVERAISVSGYFYQGKVKITRDAHEKTSVFKGATANHFIKQVTSFRVDDKDPHRQDDLLDAMCYGVSISMGNAEGW